MLFTLEPKALANHGVGVRDSYYIVALEVELPGAGWVGGVAANDNNAITNGIREGELTERGPCRDVVLGHQSVVELVMPIGGEGAGHVYPAAFDAELLCGFWILVAGKEWEQHQDDD